MDGPTRPGERWTAARVLVLVAAAAGLFLVAAFLMVVALESSLGTSIDPGIRQGEDGVVILLVSTLIVAWPAMLLACALAFVLELRGLRSTSGGVSAHGPALAAVLLLVTAGVAALSGWHEWDIGPANLILIVPAVLAAYVLGMLMSKVAPR